MAKKKKINKKARKTSKKKAKKVVSKSKKKYLEKNMKKKNQKSVKKVLTKKIKRVKKWIKENNITPENVAFTFLLIFSLTFGTLVWGVGRNFNQAENFKTMAKASLNPMEGTMKKLVKGHPIERMVPYIATKKKEVSKYLVAIAKKESNWGKFSPQKDGKDCFNYWGYRGTYNQTDSGYSCFDNPRQAVNVVGSRIKELLDQDIKTPQQMIVWKCGRSCVGHGDANVQKWIDDVEMYYNKL